MLIYTPMTPAGRPAIVASAANDAIAPPGIPGVPTDRRTFARRMMIIIGTLTCTPHAFAKNMIMNDIRIDTASMLTVAPSGIVILDIWFGTPSSSSTQLLLRGIVAELEHVPNAFNAAGMIALKNFTGLVFPRMLTAPPYTTNANPKNATYKIISCVASDIIVFVPFASTTGTIVQNTPIGVKYITVLIIFRHASLQESITFNNGSPFSPIAISVKPMISANTSTCSILPSANADTGLDGISPFTVSNILSIFVA